MDKETYSWGGIGFLAIFFLLIVAMSRNGFGWGCGNGCNGTFAGWGFNGYGVGVPGYGLGFEDYKAICQSEKQEIINSARTQYLVEEQANLTRANDTANANMLATKIDFYAYQGLRDQLAEAQRKNLVLEKQLYNDRKFGAIEAQLASISCRMAKEPQVYACSTSCSPIYTPSFCGCGCNNVA